MIGVLLAFVLALPFSVTTQAQDLQPCNIDLTEVNSLIEQAQGKYAADDVTGALLLLEQARQMIQEIETRCGTTGAPPLTGKYIDQRGIFSINYPAGWVTVPIADTPSERERGTPIFFGDSPAAFEMLSDSKAGINARGIVVYVGSGQTMMQQLGAGSSATPEATFNALSLLEAITKGQSSSSQGKFGTATQGAAIKDYATAEASFSFMDRESKPVADGYIVMMQLGSDKFAVLVAFAPPGEGEPSLNLARAMAATLESPPKELKK
jgi:hypothetical protein